MSNMKFSNYSHNQEYNYSHILVWHDFFRETWMGPCIKYIIPTFIVLGIIGNLFCVVTIICRRLHQKSAVFIFFLYMGFMDLLQNLMENKDLGEYFLDMHIFSYRDLGCRVSIWLTHSSMVSSSWVLVTLSGYRLYGLIMPLHLVKGDNRVFSFSVCSALLLIVFSLQLHVFWTHRAVRHAIGPGVIRSKCFPISPNIAMAYSTTMMVMNGLGPDCILTVLSAGICASFALSYSKHKRMLSDGEKGDNQAIRGTYAKAKTTVLLLLPLAILHALCTIPCLLYIWYIKKVVTSPDLFYITNKFALVNHSMTVYVNFAVSRFYREAMMPCLLKERANQN